MATDLRARIPNILSTDVERATCDKWLTRTRDRNPEDVNEHTNRIWGNVSSILLPRAQPWELHGAEFCTRVQFEIYSQCRIQFRGLFC